MDKAFLNHPQGNTKLKEFKKPNRDSIVLNAEKSEGSNKSTSVSSSILNSFKSMKPQALRYAIIYSLAEHLSSHDIIGDIRTPENLRITAKGIIKNSNRRGNKGLYRTLTAFENMQDAIREVENFSDNCCDLFSEDTERYLPIIGQYLRVINTKSLYLKKNVEIAKTFSATVGLQDYNIVGSDHLVGTRGFYLLAETFKDNQKEPKDVSSFYADTRTMELMLYSLLEEENLLKEVLLSINYCSTVEVESLLGGVSKVEKSILQLMLLDIFCGGEIRDDFEIPLIANRVTRLNPEYFNKYLPYNYCTTSQLRPLMVSKVLGELEDEDLVGVYGKVESMVETYINHLKSENLYSQLNNHYSVLNEDYLVMNLQQTNPKIFDSEEFRLNSLHRIPMGYLELSRYQILATKYPTSLYQSDRKTWNYYLVTHSKSSQQYEETMFSSFSYNIDSFRSDFGNQEVTPNPPKPSKDIKDTQSLDNKIINLISSFEFKMECMKELVLSYDTNDIDMQYTRSQLEDLKYYHSILDKYNLMF